MANTIWTGTIDGSTYRVVDRGSTAPQRLTVELLAGADAMGVPSWQRFDPIPTPVFTGILVSAGVIA